MTPEERAEMMSSEEMVKQQFKYFEWYSDSGTHEIHWSNLETYLNLLRNQSKKESRRQALEEAIQIIHESDPKDGEDGLVNAIRALMGGKDG